MATKKRKSETEENHSQSNRRIPLKHKKPGFAIPAPKMFKDSFYWKTAFADQKSTKSDDSASTSQQESNPSSSEKEVKDHPEPVKMLLAEVETMERIDQPVPEVINSKELKDRLGKYEELVNIWSAKSTKRLHNLLTKSPKDFAESTCSRITEEQTTRRIITPKNTTQDSFSWLKDLPAENPDQTSFNLDSQLLSQIIKGKRRETKRNPLPEREFSDFWTSPPLTPVLKVLESTSAGTSLPRTELNFLESLNSPENASSSTHFWDFPPRREKRDRSMFF